uniref:NADH-ubiquinone oxidoreductase chain 2 n=1 Tax=Gerrhopilus ceylonicus TaxID=3148149 RepID=A0PDM9_9SAUR|nr:NADH dehydrogenase subunit 2 [Gerrhopilus mirus]
MSTLPYMIIITSIITGTLITMTSQHWLMAWLGLELNTLAIIPMIMYSHHPRATEATTKYFLIQATASSLLLFATTTNAWSTGQWDMKLLSMFPSTIMLTLALLMKMGAAPFHFWVPEVLQGVPTLIGLTILTWQKLAPLSLIIMSTNNIHHKTLIMSATLSVLLGGWGGMNQTQLRKLMAYSSISHVGWMMAATLVSPKITLLTLLIYILLTIPMFLSIHFTLSKTIKDTGTMWIISPTTSLTTMLILLSLAGMPPLTGFLPKWMILKELLHYNLIIVATLIAMLSLLSLYFYLNLSYMTTMTISPNTNSMMLKGRLKHNKLMMFSLLSSMAIFILPVLPLFT